VSLDALIELAQCALQLLFEPSHLLFQFFNPTILGEDDDVLTGIRLAVWASGALAHDLLLLLVAQRLNAAPYLFVGIQVLLGDARLV